MSEEHKYCIDKDDHSWEVGYDKGYRQGRTDERERIAKELETLRDIAWQDTDSDKRIVRSNAWDKVDLLDKAIEIVRSGENE